MPASPPPPHRLLPVGRIGLAVALLASAAGPVTLCTRERTVAERQALQPPVEAPALPVDVHAGEDGGLLPPRTRLPDGPLSGQRRPPCERGTFELAGGCWLRSSESPPCPAGTVEHEGACYVPLAAKRRPATSVEE